MILPVHASVRARLQDGLTRAFGLAPADQPPIVIETPPKRALGDLAVPVAFELARKLRQPPRAIAQALAGAVGAIDGVSRVAAAPNGYLNFYLDRAALLRDRLARDDRPATPRAEKVIV
jgi:arginyl-tRNA synthetase